MLHVEPGFSLCCRIDVAAAAEDYKERRYKPMKDLHVIIRVTATTDDGMVDKCR